MKSTPCCVRPRSSIIRPEFPPWKPPLSIFHPPCPKLSVACWLRQAVFNSESPLCWQPLPGRSLVALTLLALYYGILRPPPSGCPGKTEAIYRAWGCALHPETMHHFWITRLQSQNGKPRGHGTAAWALRTSFVWGGQGDKAQLLHGRCGRATLVSSISRVPTTTVAGGCRHACFADQETRKGHPRLPHLHWKPCWKHLDHLLLSDQVEERILLSLGVQLAVSFLHPGSVLSVTEKHDLYHVSLYIYEQSLIHPNIHQSLNSSITELISSLNFLTQTHFFFFFYELIFYMKGRIFSSYESISEF